ncbi:PREDICTED: uncharacterized protein LOC106810295 [Priapulus caudatus]|uniref:Uncharacterized protein LOC106810295 n=1 Tax=Priapulus caudatus TaxID=37621 RepID=A0ABM1EA67_PRICU|nr:PREDICTED: uncharacterized protein LOC106810295 [Priapulus caudatus]
MKELTGSVTAGKSISMTDFVRSHSDEFLLEGDLVISAKEPQRFDVARIWRPSSKKRGTCSATNSVCSGDFPPLGKHTTLVKHTDTVPASSNDAAFLMCKEGLVDVASDQDVRDIMNARQELDRCLHTLDDAMATMQTERASVPAAGSSSSEGEQVLSSKHGQLVATLDCFGFIGYDSSLVYFNKESLHPPANCDTLRRYLTNNEILNFDAKLAPPGCDTRWIATRVWRQANSVTPVDDGCAVGKHC